MAVFLIFQSCAVLNATYFPFSVSGSSVLQVLGFGGFFCVVLWFCFFLNIQLKADLENIGLFLLFYILESFVIFLSVFSLG